MWRQGAQWGPLPPMDNVFVTTLEPARDSVADSESPAWMPNREALGDWFAETLRLAVQPESRVFFNAAASRFSQDRLLCARRGAVVGAKPRVFTGRADAIVFRNAAYRLAGLDAEGTHAEIPSFPRYPPRRITLLNRRGQRELLNAAAVEAALRATGLEVKVVENLSALPFREQVATMARTGLLVAPFSGELANMVFLPAHAAVIELFPYGLRSARHKSLAPLLDLVYDSLQQRVPTAHEGRGARAGAQAFYAKAYYDNCAALNISGFETLAHHSCRQAALGSPLLVDVARLAPLVADALEATGAFSHNNPAWKAEAARTGAAAPAFEAWLEAMENAAKEAEAAAAAEAAARGIERKG